jgi:hypothetical protein
VLPDPGDHHVFPDPDPLYVEEPEPEPRPGASGCYRDVAVFLLVVVPLVAAALGLAAAWRKRA